MLRIEDSAQGIIRHEYDAAHRLARRILPGNKIEEYAFDQADNLIKQPGLRDVQLREGNRLAAVNGLTVAYNGRNHIAECQTELGEARYR